MQYRKDKYGNDISALGYGCMRFTKKGNSADLDKAEKEVMAAIEAGVNYFDTAYVYAGNEVAVGEILHRNHCREKINLATKLPHYLIKSIDGVEKMFQEELRRLQTDYIDYYLMHMLTDIPTWEKLKKLGMEEWIREKKASGQIRQIGFSYHGNSAMFCQLVDAYDWDFCQIQYNYMDEHSQAGVEGLRYANKKGLPVIIMEPLRGGRLVNLLPEPAKELFRKDEQHRTPAELALKWLYNQPEVTCVLSGMNSMEMVEQNVKTASESLVGCLTESDQELIEKVKAELQKMTDKKVIVDIKEVKRPDKDAQLVAENIAQQLENRISFRRAMKSCMSRTMKSGALGVKTSVSGRLGGADMARTEFYSEGTIPLQTLRADIDYGFAEANTTYGKVGVKVWIYKGEVLPEKTVKEGDR